MTINYLNQQVAWQLLIIQAMVLYSFFFDGSRNGNKIYNNFPTAFPPYMDTPTEWTNMSEGVIAFSCTQINTQGQLYSLVPISCISNLISLKFHLFFGIFLIFLSLYQFWVYHYSHGKKLFKIRSRIIYLNIAFILCSAICHSILNVLAVYQLFFFAQQLLYWQIAGYLILKIAKLTMGTYIKISKTILWILLLLLLIYLLFSISANPSPTSSQFCPGAFESQYFPLKALICICMIGLHISGVYFLVKLLGREDSSFYDNNSRIQRNTQLLKLKLVLIAVVICEVLQLLVSILHFPYFDSEAICSFLGATDHPEIESITVTLFRFTTIDMPGVIVLWLIWLPRMNKKITPHNAVIEVFSSRSESSFYSQSLTMSSRPTGYSAKGTAMVL